MATTHEAFIHGVAAIVARRATSEQRDRLKGIKLVYGAGASGLRGVTYFNKWHGHDCQSATAAPGSASVQTAAPFVEVCAFGQESWVQLAGTTIHELAHVVAGWEAAHGKGWKETAEQLGLRCPKAASMVYHLASFEPVIRAEIAALARPNEGEPVRSLGLAGGMPKPCTAGIGTRGGTSRGKGSGSRLRKYVCECVPSIIVRHAGDHLAATCDHCRTAFKQA